MKRNLISMIIMATSLLLGQSMMASEPYGSKEEITEEQIRQAESLIDEREMDLYFASETYRPKEEITKEQIRQAESLINEREMDLYFDQLSKMEQEQKEQKRIAEGTVRFKEQVEVQGEGEKPIEFGPKQKPRRRSRR